MKKYILITFLLSFYAGFSQVKDISFTISPTAEYTWWDTQAGLEDGMFYGAKVGFGFGEYLELRGVYSQSDNINTRFNDYGFTNFNEALMVPQKVDITRWGGEVKANLGTNSFNPYITFGTGVQTQEIATGSKFEQIYAGLGLGFKVNLTDRIILALEGKNTMYNFNSAENLLSPEEKTVLGVTSADFSNERLSNWSALASLQFYLGGRNPGELSNLDKAYLKKFKGGFKGLQWIVEPSANYIKFDNSSLFRDTYLLGGYAGLDFNEYTGFRLFYLRATNNEEISFDFDKLSMYGLEFRARLNDGNGVTPYLILGGGYLDAYSNYLGKNDLEATSTEFASAGLGLNIPLSKNFLITGGARALVTSGQNVEDLQSPNELQTHLMYNAGIKITFGKKSASPDDIYDSNMNEALNEQEITIQEKNKKTIEAQKVENQQKITKLKAAYTVKIDSLNSALNKAYNENDVDRAVIILEEKKNTQDALNEVKKFEVKSVSNEIQGKTESVKTQQELIQMTPAQFESLLDRILKGMETSQTNGNYQKPVEVSPKNISENEQQINDIKQQIDALNDLLVKASEPVEQNKNVEKAQISNVEKELNDKIERLEKQIDLNEKKIEKLSKNDNDPQTIIVSPAQNEPDTIIINTTTDNKDAVSATSVNNENVTVEVISSKQTKFIQNERSSKINSKLTYKGTSAFTGFNVGEQSTANVGVRMHYGLPNTTVELMPEVFVGFANPTSYGLSVNGLLPMNVGVNKNIHTYAGLGAGFIYNNDNLDATANIILGTYLNVANGRLYIDYTNRNLFKYNQFSMGYRFSF
ncbi:MAG TPA: hypothetical protein VLM44_02715 [Lutibacter sp.]|nr:hypothetical protein [Lutibacter sp.]